MHLHLDVSVQHPGRLLESRAIAQRAEQFSGPQIPAQEVRVGSLPGQAGKGGPGFVERARIRRTLMAVPLAQRDAISHLWFKGAKA